MNIRRANRLDVEAIAECMMLAMGNIVCNFMERTDYGEAIALLKHFIVEENNQYSFQNCWVVEDAGEVIASANLYDGAKLKELRKPVEVYIKILYNRHFKPEDETSAGEYYIDTLGVVSNRQGQGIGTVLLHALIDEYVFLQGKTLGLLVEKDNNKAKHLYQKLGFMQVGTQVLGGKNMEHLQVNNYSVKKS